ncbi:sugar ABC transporter permease [Eshraghiella crossota]|jgi:arabinogalactan oligomer/maltooligosaccharide transport system permease protein|uniref:sugar ABC transporter permease n=1 Tax=Eshraghiella crossota TaxID=45851 RepID=UPI001D5EEDC6|nr:ABC transporter permease subunit [Butyrivibrio crossotus]
MKKVSSGAKVRKIIGNIFVYIILTVLSIIWLFPIVWIVLISFKKDKGMYMSTLFPKEYWFGNYKKLFTDTNIINFPQMFLNTLIIAVFCCIISTFFVLCVSYVMSRMRFRMRRPFMNIALILGMFPGFMSMIATYYILKSIGLTQGSMIRIALIMVYSGGSGLGFYIAKGFFDTIPKSVDEAAYIDGATRWQVFTRITIPLSKPIIVYTVLNSFMGPWLDFIFCKVICGTDQRFYTVSVGLWNMLEKEYVYNWFNCFAAGAVVVSVPIAILFLVMQKFYQEGVSGAVKG